MPLSPQDEERLRKEWEAYLKSIVLYGETDSRIADWWITKMGEKGNILKK